LDPLSSLELKVDLIKLLTSTSSKTSTGPL